MAGEIINQFKEINGSDVFDRQIDSEGTAKSKAKEEGTRERPFNVGLFQEVKDVSWGLGQFSYGGSTPAAQDEGIVKTSDDGVSWQSAEIDFGEHTQFRVSIGGLEPTGSNQSGSEVLLAGGNRFIRLGEEPGGVVIGFFEPILAFTFGGGVWEQASFSSLAREDNDGFTNAVGYDPKTKLFYVTVNYDVEGRVTYVGTPNTGFGEFSRGSEFPAYPEKIKLCDKNGGSRADIRFVSSNSGNQVVKSTDGDGNPVEFNLNTFAPPVPNPVSICGRRGIMVMLCAPQGRGSGDEFAFVSKDGGASWGSAFGPVGPDGSVSFS